MSLVYEFNGSEFVAPSSFNAQDASLEAAGTGSWVAWLGNTTFARSTAASLAGTASLALTAQAAGDVTLRTSGAAGSMSAHAVTPGQVYTAVASFLAASYARAVVLSISWRDGAGALISQVDGPSSFDRTGSWQQARVVGQAPASAAFCFVGVTVVGCAAAEVHYVDAISLSATPTANLIGNPDFEVGSTGWVSGGTTPATLVRSTEQAYIGRSSLKATWPAAALNTTSIYTTVATVVGKTYTFSVWVLQSANPRVQLRVGGTQGAAGSVSAASANWQRLFLTFTATATSTNVDVVNADVASSGQVTYFDAFQLVTGSAALDYVPPVSYNLFRNTSIQAGGYYFPNGSAVLTQDFTRSLFGSSSVKVVTDGANPNFHQISSELDVTLTYTGSFYVFTTTGGSFFGQLYDQIFTGSGFVVGSPVTVPANTWTRVTVTGKVTSAGASQISLVISGPNNHTFYIDGVQLEMGSVATPYVDGSLGSAYAFEGADNPVLNPGFETDASSWAVGTDGTPAGTETWVASGGPDNSPYVQYAAGLSVNRNYFIVYNTLSNGIRVPAGTLLTFSFWARYGAGQTTQALTYVRLVDTSLSSPSTATLSFQPSTTWKRFVLTTVTTAQVGSANVVYFNTQSAAKESKELHLAKVQLETRPYATTYLQTNAAATATSRRQFPWVLPSPPPSAAGVKVRVGGVWVDRAVYRHNGSTFV